MTESCNNENVANNAKINNYTSTYALSILARLNEQIERFLRSTNGDDREQSCCDGRGHWIVAR